MIDTGREVIIIKPNCEEFLKSDLNHHALAVYNSQITTYSQRSLTLDSGLSNQVDWVFLVVMLIITYSVQIFYRTFDC